MMNPDSLSRGSLRWYWNRARVMSASELSHRAAHAVRGLADHTLRHLQAVQPALHQTASFPAPWLASATHRPTMDAAQHLREADLLCEGSVERLDRKLAVLGMPPRWQADPREVRDGQASGTHHDIRFEIELHRHGHFVRLAQAWILSRQAKYLDALLTQLDGWLDQCTEVRGVAWTSALDAGLRLLNWSLIWQWLRADRADGDVPNPLRTKWLASIHAHAHFVRRNRSRHSSANNHLAGELLGLVVAEATWPVWKDVVAWGAAARREFLVEALRQTHEDGGNCEQASWYQGFLFEMLAVFVQIERSATREVDPRLLRRMGLMAGFMAALRDAGGHLSHHGDADHARALGVEAGPVDACERMVALAVALGVAEHLQALALPSGIAPWLIGPGEHRPAASPAQRLAARRTLPRAFPQGGHHLLGCRFGETDEVLMIMDTGSLGYLSIAAHGHADALSLRLSVAGHPVLVDRGTFTYNAEPAWRRFFRSTLAHNTVCVDDADSSEYGGPFLWLKHARCHLDAFASDDLHGHIEAHHDGYCRLPEPLMHGRQVQWNQTSRRFIVTDTLQSHGSHDVAIAWHFDPACQVEVDGGEAHVRVPSGVLRLTVGETGDQQGRWSLHCGASDEMLGWHSPAFGIRVPAPSLIWRSRIDGPRTVSTFIDIPP